MNFNKILTKMFCGFFFTTSTFIRHFRTYRKVFQKSTWHCQLLYTIVRNKMHTQNNGYNMKMSSKYDQSGTEPSFLPPQGLLSRSSRPRGERGCVSLPKPHAVSRGSLTIPSQSHFQKTFLLIYFLKMGVCKTCDFSNSTLSYVGNLFTSRRPRCSKVLF